MQRVHSRSTSQHRVLVMCVIGRFLFPFSAVVAICASGLSLHVLFPSWLVRLRFSSSPPSPPHTSTPTRTHTRFPPNHSHHPFRFSWLETCSNPALPTHDVEVFNKQTCLMSSSLDFWRSCLAFAPGIVERFVVLVEVQRQQGEERWDGSLRKGKRHASSTATHKDLLDEDLRKLRGGNNFYLGYTTTNLPYQFWSDSFSSPPATPHCVVHQNFPSWEGPQQKTKQTKLLLLLLSFTLPPLSPFLSFTLFFFSFSSSLRTPSFLLSFTPLFPPSRYPLSHKHMNKSRQ